MNLKKLILTIAGVFLTFFVTDFVIHGVILKSMYQASPQLWRAESEMSSFMPFMFLGQFLVSAFFVLIFQHGYKGRGPVEGVRFGLLMAGYSAGANLVMYAVVPYPLALTFAWIALGAAQAVLGGVVAALITDRLK